MRIKEIINEFEVRTRQGPATFGSQAELDPIKQAAREKGKFTGGYSSVTPKAPLQGVQKTTHIGSNLENDAYYQYIMAAKPFMGKNPYFPVVSKVNIVKSKDGQSKPYYNIEQLVSPKQRSTTEILFMGDKIIKDFRFLGSPAQSTLKTAIGKVSKYIPGMAAPKRYMKPKAGLTADTAFNSLIAKINNAIESGNYNEILDKNLVSAIKLVSQVKASNPNFRWDLGTAGNWMIRNTDAGLQLVMSDPIDDAGASQMAPPAAPAAGAAQPAPQPAPTQG